MVRHYFVNIIGVFHHMEHLIPFGHKTWETKAQNYDPVKGLVLLLMQV